MCDSIPIHIFSIWPSILHLINRMPNPTCSWHSQPSPGVSWGIYAQFLTFPRIRGFKSKLPWNQSQATTQINYFICIIFYCSQQVLSRKTAGLPIIHSGWHALVAASLYSDSQRYQLPVSQRRSCYKFASSSPSTDGWSSPWRGCAEAGDLSVTSERRQTWSNKQHLYWAYFDTEEFPLLNTGVTDPDSRALPDTLPRRRQDNY